MCIQVLENVLMSYNVYYIIILIHVYQLLGFIILV